MRVRKDKDGEFVLVNLTFRLEKDVYHLLKGRFGQDYNIRNYFIQLVLSETGKELHDSADKIK